MGIENVNKDDGIDKAKLELIDICNDYLSNFDEERIKNRFLPSNNKKQQLENDAIILTKHFLDINQDLKNNNYETSPEEFINLLFDKTKKHSLYEEITSYIYNGRRRDPFLLLFFIFIPIISPFLIAFGILTLIIYIITFGKVNLLDGMKNFIFYFTNNYLNPFIEKIDALRETYNLKNPETPITTSFVTPQEKEEETTTDSIDPSQIKLLSTYIEKNNLKKIKRLLDDFKNQHLQCYFESIDKDNSFEMNEDEKRISPLLNFLQNYEKLLFTNLTFNNHEGKHFHDINPIIYAFYENNTEPLYLITSHIQNLTTSIETHLTKKEDFLKKQNETNEIILKKHLTENLKTITRHTNLISPTKERETQKKIMPIINDFIEKYADLNLRLEQWKEEQISTLLIQNEIEEEIKKFTKTYTALAFSNADSTLQEKFQNEKAKIIKNVLSDSMEKSKSIINEILKNKNKIQNIEMEKNKITEHVLKPFRKNIMSQFLNQKKNLDGSGITCSYKTKDVQRNWRHEKKIVRHHDDTDLIHAYRTLLTLEEPYYKKNDYIPPSSPIPIKIINNAIKNVEIEKKALPIQEIQLLNSIKLKKSIYHVNSNKTTSTQNDDLFEKHKEDYDLYKQIKKTKKENMENFITSLQPEDNIKNINQNEKPTLTPKKTQDLTIKNIEKKPDLFSNLFGHVGKKISVEELKKTIQTPYVNPTIIKLNELQKRTIELTESAEEFTKFKEELNQITEEDADEARNDKTQPSLKIPAEDPTRQDDILKIIGAHIPNKKDALSFFLTDKHLYTLFHKERDFIILLNKLCSFVETSGLADTKKFLNKHLMNHPELLSAKTTLTDGSGRTFHDVTIPQYLMWEQHAEMLDTLTFAIKNLKENQKQLHINKQLLEQINELDTIGISFTEPTPQNTKQLITHSHEYDMHLLEQTHDDYVLMDRTLKKNNIPVLDPPHNQALEYYRQKIEWARKMCPYWITYDPPPANSMWDRRWWYEKKLATYKDLYEKQKQRTEEFKNEIKKSIEQEESIEQENKILKQP